MRVLVVEDHRDTCQMMTRLLSRWGYDVAAANTLEAGLAQLAKGPFDVILSDIALPDGTGYALISEVRRRGSDVMAIALSGYEYPEDVRLAKLTGFDYHLSKPCDCSQLRALLEERIARSTSRKAESKSAETERKSPRFNL